MVQQAAILGYKIKNSLVVLLAISPLGGATNSDTNERRWVAIIFPVGHTDLSEEPQVVVRVGVTILWSATVSWGL